MCGYESGPGPDLPRCEVTVLHVHNEQGDMSNPRPVWLKLVQVGGPKRKLWSVSAGQQLAICPATMGPIQKNRLIDHAKDWSVQGV